MARGEGESSDGQSSAATMSSVFRQAIGAIKDQTSISLAKFSAGSSDIEVAILKATSHDEVPIDERNLADVLLLSAASPSSAATCLQILSRRISRTSNWVVALKSLVIVFRLLCNGGSQFIHEALAAGASSRRLLDLSAFRDHSAASSPWDYSAFVRTFAVYLDARLESDLLGKLSNLGRRPFMPADVFANMRTPLIFGHIEHWQRLLDRAVGTRPTGPAKTNRLVQIALFLVVCETFSLYHDISNGLSMLLDNFFHLQPESRLQTLHACMKARKQFEELDSFYDLCKKIGVGRMSEYPCVQKISVSLLKALEDFLENAAPNSLGTSPITKPKNPLKLKQMLKDQQSDMTGGGSTSTGETISDGETAMSDHQDWQIQATSTSSSSSSSNGEICMVNRLHLLDDKPKTSNDSSVTTASVNPVQGPRPVMPSKSSLSWDNAGQPESFHNPFLHSDDDRGLVMKSPSPPTLLPPPKFCGNKANKELVCEEKDGAQPSTSAAQGTDASMRQQHMWMQQQSNSISNRLSC
ncbi:clathrin coat assembly protein AP180-like [Musa acuminata AAA Group]|uniref:clathrin coat assembly protein AP180-like n=1 Tax=Musa acuminata AAA Group TaxID=214697 RepID=UPI0031D7F76B